MEATKPTIKLKTLQLIAREIVNLGTDSFLKAFFNKCGIDEGFLKSKDMAWETLYSCMAKLSESEKLEDKEVLFSIVEAPCNPNLYDSQMEFASDYERLTADLLKYEGLAFINHTMTESKFKGASLLDVFIMKKILMGDKNGHAFHYTHQLKFLDSSTIKIISSLWNLYALGIISFGEKTTKELDFSRNLQKKEIYLCEDLNTHPYFRDSGFDIILLNQELLGKNLSTEIDLFKSDKLISHRIRYTYEKQKKIFINKIRDLHREFESEKLHMPLNPLYEQSEIDALRMILALEEEGFIDDLQMCIAGYSDSPIRTYGKVTFVAFKANLYKISNFLQTIETCKSKTQASEELKPIPIRIVGTPSIEIKNIEQNVVLRKTKNTKIEMRKFPPYLKWNEIAFHFLNEQEVIIKYIDAKDRNIYTFQTDYLAMGFEDEKKKQPNAAWNLLINLRDNNGQISWQQRREKPFTDKKAEALKQEFEDRGSIRRSPVPDKIKHQKKLLADTLKKNFPCEGNPFHDYRKIGSYKIKIILNKPSQ